MDYARFLRNLAAYLAAAGVAWLIANYTKYGIPIYLIPIIGFVLNAIADWLRNNFAPQALAKASLLSRFVAKIF